MKCMHNLNNVTPIYKKIDDKYAECINIDKVHNKQYKSDSKNPRVRPKPRADCWVKTILD